MKVKFKKLVPNAVLPTKAHNSDFCYDVTAVSRAEILPNVYKYGLGFALEVERNGEIPDDLNVCVDIRPRSSIHKTGLVFSNSVATIDEGYRGELSMVFYHVIPSLPPYEVGDRIGQIVLDFADEMLFEEAEELSPSDRGTNGYGSTGR